LPPIGGGPPKPPKPDKPPKPPGPDKPPKPPKPDKPPKPPGPPKTPGPPKLPPLPPIGGGPPKPPPGGPPGAGPTPEELARWKIYDKGWESLSDEDKKVIKKVFPTPQNKQAFFNLNAQKQKSLAVAVADGKITDAEEKSLYKIFGYKPPDDDDDDDDDDDTTDDDQTGDDGDDGGDGDDEGDGDDDVPTERGGKDNVIKVPKPDSRANYTVPLDSTEAIDMPDLNKEIKEEIDKLTSELVNITKEFIEGGINFQSIDFFPKNEIFDDEGNSYYELPDYNSIPGDDAGLSSKRMDDIKELIWALLSKGDQQSENYNYNEFLNLFTLKYDGDGKPYFRFSIELTGAIIDDLTVTLVDDEND
jgi:hypothetical protein